MILNYVMQIKRTEKHYEHSNYSDSSLDNVTEIEINDTLNLIHVIEEPRNMKYIDLLKKTFYTMDPYL
ncbi:hypothetical protein H311_03401 [Anncaliia algerae PRA109]|nr:hypothetical protein H311_03401 [Anncaliia algerae PRA109]